MSIYVNIRKLLGNFALNVEFEAESGVIGLLGASGCGKSMTLGCIAGVIRPDEGKIVVNGVTFFDSEKKINLQPQKRRVGLLFQHSALFPNMTVERNILSVLSKNRKARLAERFASLIGKFYLRGLENHYPAQLSGGQQQRAALARIMASEPALLMLDEPLSALDSYLRWQLEGELAQILEEFEGVVLYVSHNRREVYRLCDMVCVMNEGRSEKIQVISELFESPNTFASALLSGCKNYSRAERAGDRIVRAIDWGVDLACGAPVSDEVRYIGVHAHYVSLVEKSGFPCRVTRVIDDVFSTFVNMEPLTVPDTSLTEASLAEANSHSFSSIHVQSPKRLEKLECGDVVFIEIDPSHVMLLGQ